MEMGLELKEGRMDEVAVGRGKGVGKAWGSLCVTGTQRPWCDAIRCMGLEEIGRPPKVGRIEMGVVGWAPSGDGRGRWAQSGGGRGR